MNRVLRIIVVDADPLSFQLVQHSFLYDNVDVLWMPEPAMLYSFRSTVDVVLMQVEESSDYDIVASVHQKHPSAALFLLSDPLHYDAFEARNSGAIGAFLKPLSAGVIQNRLTELLPGLVPPNIEDVFVPNAHQTQAQLVSFAPNHSHQTDLEGIVEELLPMVVEQVLRLQMAAETPFKQQLRTEIRALIARELTSKDSS